MHTQSIALTGDVLPPDVGTRVAELQRLDDAEGQARAVTAMLSHARTGLLAAIAAHDLPQIVEFKAKAAAIQEIAKQVRLGRDMQLDAAEFVRRAERGLGVAIREGQARGEIETAREGKVRGAATRDHRVDNTMIKPKPTDFADTNELSGNGAGIYSLTDNVSDDQFEEALTEAKDEGNLSRANVARKAKAKAEELNGDLTASDIVHLAREIPSIPGRRHAAVAAEKFGISKRTYERIKQVVDSAENDMTGEVREYASWLVGDLDSRRITPTEAEKSLAEFRSEIDADVAPNPDSTPRPFKKSDAEMLAEITSSLTTFADLIKWIRPNRIDSEEANALASQARTAWRAINKHLKEIEQ
ncbi:hypothetical protein SAMN04488550_4189 [Gordonia malaquae]|uniref:Uncharacterized protein n=1 Tax=Gordonia malaquae NBRC 108250 TaxID=1223542 RepID=M3VH56_GORML|nr:hypothetical protein [Gordonia malaquae]GAC81659.1 hypothetical protein GM1_041_00300 [Gordonia malaquae NBRC 108250]SEE27313.1 hypothetical protein SAMN04488550_4189 [Gordonia malaquae]